MSFFGKPHQPPHNKQVDDLLNLAYCQAAMEDAHEADSNGWLTMYTQALGEVYVRQDHGDYSNGIGWKDKACEPAMIWMFICGEDGQVSIRRQVSDETLEIKPSDKEEYEQAKLVLEQVSLNLIKADHARTENLARTVNLSAAQRLDDIRLPIDVWGKWIQSLHDMEARARRRGWAVRALEIHPPATPEQLTQLETDHGIQVPGQLKQLLLEFSAEIKFGWNVSRDDTPTGPLASLYDGGIRDTVWSLHQIDDYAIDNFRGWHAYFFEGPSRETEQPNPRSLWEHQFPFAHLMNGDVLTIDCTQADPVRQPVRYFSHEADGLHGKSLAPNLFAFLDQWTALGCVGQEQGSWLGLVRMHKGQTALRFDSAIGKKWIKWLNSDPNIRAPDEAPRPRLAKTIADERLLAAAKDNDLAGVLLALEEGAVIDCSPDDWVDENYTALVYAAKHSNVQMLEALRSRGASLSTTLLPLDVAVRSSDVATVRWLVANGSRLNRWKDDRYCPLHELISSDRSIEDYRVMFQILLDAGADPNAYYDIESSAAKTTALMRVGSWSTQKLLAAGADPTLRDIDGRNALHFARAESVPLLLAAGLDVNELSLPTKEQPARTALQSALLNIEDPIDTVNALLLNGADPHLADSNNDSAWWYCCHASTVQCLCDLGFGADQRDGLGQTLLHRLLVWTGGRLYNHYMECARTLVTLGLPVNAQDSKGDSVLHVAARSYDSQYDLPSLKFLLELGADAGLTNRSGKKAWQLVRKKFPKAIEILRGDSK